MKQVNLHMKKANANSIVVQVEPFDEEEHEPEEWLAMFEDVASTSAWNDQVKVTKLSGFVTGSVASFLRYYRDTKPNATWDDIKTAMCKYFTKDSDEFVRQIRMEERKKEPDESLAKYMFDKLRLIRRYKGDMLPANQVTQIVKGLPANIRTYVSGKVFPDPEALYDKIHAVVDLMAGRSKTSSTVAEDFLAFGRLRMEEDEQEAAGLQEEGRVNNQVNAAAAAAAAANDDAAVIQARQAAEEELGNNVIKVMNAIFQQQAKKAYVQQNTGYPQQVNPGPNGNNNGDYSYQNQYNNGYGGYVNINDQNGPGGYNIRQKYGGRRNNNNGYNNQQQPNMSPASKPVICFRCGQEGHVKAGCRRPPKTEGSQPVFEMNIIASENSKVIHLPVLIDGKTTTGMVDTGSALTIIRGTPAQKLGLANKRQRKKEGVILRFGNGATEVCNYEYVTQMEFQGRKWEMSILEYNLLPYELILGVNWVRHSGMFSNVLFNELPLFSVEIRKQQKVKIQLSRDTSIPPRSTVWVPVCASEQLEGDHVMIPAHQNAQRFGIQTLPSINKFEAGHSGTFVSNITYHQQHLPKGITLGVKNTDDDDDEEFQPQKEKKPIVFSINKELNKEQTKLLKTVLLEYVECFDTGRLCGSAKHVEHRISINPDVQPIKQRQYRAPIAQQEIIKKQVHDMQDGGVIRSRKSECVRKEVQSCY